MNDEANEIMDALFIDYNAICEEVWLENDTPERGVNRFMGVVTRRFPDTSLCALYEIRCCAETDYVNPDTDVEYRLEVEGV